MINEEKLKEFLKKYTGGAIQNDQVTKDRIDAAEEIFLEE